MAGIKDGSAEGDLGLWVQAHLQRLSEASNGSQKQWQGEVRVGSPQIIGFDTQAYGAVYRSTVEVRLRIEERGQVVWAQTLQQGAVWSRRSSLVNTESARRQALKVAVELAVQTLWQHAQD